jgi:CCR4-NOT transcription complex subunit 6
MQNKKLTVFLVLGAFILGYAFFRLTAPQIGSKTGSTQQEATTIPTIQTGSSLNLSGKGLDKLPSYVLSRFDLVELNISNNLITGALPSEIGKLRNLKVLNASNNLMTGVPAEVGQLTNLEVLDLSNNQLTGLPNELANLKKLKTLNLSGNNYSVQDLDVIKRGLSPDVNIIL